MIRTIKEILRKHLGRTRLGQYHLATLLAEVTSIINEPLTPLTENGGCTKPLTPAHLLNGWRGGHFPPEFAFERLAVADTSSELRQQEKRRRQVLAEFWIRFRKEYQLNFI